MIRCMFRDATRYSPQLREMRWAGMHYHCVPLEWVAQLTVNQGAILVGFTHHLLTQKK